jgi:uncharacterized cofD-like protein
MPSLTRVSQQQQGRLKAPLKIVSIGGGTGLSTLLSGIKKFASGSQRLPDMDAPKVEITAVVTVSDDGGSSGRLRRDFDILPPGDIRNCMTALSEDEALLSQLFRYRFASGHGLKGHSFGNLFLTAMHQITGDFAQAVKLSSEILAIRGHIFPATAANVTLEAVLVDGSIVRGESTISKSRQPIRQIRLHPTICKPLPDVLTALAEADLITLGPGSLYTSVVPNILVKGMAEAIEKSPAMKVYFVNLMWQPGETINFTASQHVKVILAHAKRKLIDCVVLNSAPISATLRRLYERDKVKPVENDMAALVKLGVKIVTADLVSEAAVAQKRIRHDSAALAEVVLDLASRSRAFQVRKEVLAAKALQLK